MSRKTNKRPTPRNNNRRIESEQAVKDLLKHPEKIGIRAGFKDLTPLHGQWIREIVFGTEDYTLQAHRGSYKSSSLAVAIALIMILDPTHNIIFLRKADNDVAEMLRMVAKILRTQIMNDISMVIHGKKLCIVTENVDQISTNLWNSPSGAPQLLGLGIKSSITGKHAQYVITDDICNIQDYQSAAEREHTNLQYDELQNIRNRGGRIINLGTPWHRHDVFRKMPNIHRYDCYHTGLISRKTLTKLRRSMSPHLFAANYELKLLSNAEAVFTEPPQIIDTISTFLDCEAHIDASYEGTDYTALTIISVDYEMERLYLYGRLWHKSVQDVLPEIKEELERFQVYHVVCEDNADRGFLKQILQGMMPDMWISTYHETQNKKIKILTYLRACWEKILFLDETDPKYLRQIVEYCPAAEHDDAPDSAATACRYYCTYHWEPKN